MVTELKNRSRFSATDSGDLSVIVPECRPVDSASDFKSEDVSRGFYSNFAEQASAFLPSQDHGRSRGDGRFDAEGIGRMAIIITDLDMPMMAGVDLTPHPCRLCVMPGVVLPTVSDDAAKQLAEAVSKTDWVTKPSKPEQLLALVSQVVRT